MGDFFVNSVTSALYRSTRASHKDGVDFSVVRKFLFYDILSVFEERLSTLENRNLNEESSILSLTTFVDSIWYVLYDIFDVFIGMIMILMLKKIVSI